MSIFHKFSNQDAPASDDTTKPADASPTPGTEETTKPAEATPANG